MDIRRRNEQEILQLSRDHGLELKSDSLQFKESGLDFQVVMAMNTAGEHWILRFPRREDVLPSVAREKRTLELISPLLSIEVPRWFICTNELIAYKALQGRPAATIDMEAKAYVWQIDEKNVPDQFHETLAGGIASLHKVSIEKARAVGFEVETIEEVRTSMQRRMGAVQSEFDVANVLWNRWQAWLQNDELWPSDTALIHGDLHAGHILIDEQSRVTGFIDWTEAAVADRAIDLVAHYRTFGEDALEKLIAAYGRAGGDVWPGMAEHVIELTAAYPVVLAEFALKSGIDEYMEMARQSLNPDSSD